jgi:hypothetical protein
LGTRNILELETSQNMGDVELVLRREMKGRVVPPGAQAAREMGAKIPPHVCLWTKEQAVSPILMELEGHEGSVQGCAVFHGGKRAVSAAGDKTLMI